MRACALLLVVLWREVDAAPRLTVTCDDPQGTTTLYERGLLELGEQRWETLPTVYAGAHPTFLLDDATPHILYGTWGAAPDETMAAPSPPPSVAAMVLLEARGQITAVFAGAQTVWIYSLFPKLGIGVFTSARTLTELGAPQEVLEECRWSCALELSETYEIRTPERRDLRDPLLIGQCGSQRYRVALWGESLRPFADIAAGAGALLAWVGLCCTGLLTRVYAPETHQQRFLDRYRCQSQKAA